MLGVGEEEGFTEAVYLCGLRQNGRDRSNLAFQNMGAPGGGSHHHEDHGVFRGVGRHECPGA